MQDRGPAAYIAEFIGTLALVFFITMAASGYVSSQAGAYIDFGVIGLVHVFALFMLIQTLAVVSGAHFNPAVTAAMTALRQIKPADAGIYIVVQLAGGVVGALLTKLLTHNFPNADAVNFGAPSVAGRLDGSVPLGMLAEGIGTFFLVWAIVGVAVNPAGIKDWSGLVIGGTLGLAVFTIGPFTGGSFNPARAFGPDLVSGEFGGFGNFLLAYVGGPVIGGVLAGFVYHYLYIAPGKKGLQGMEPVG
jgi:glycerol uptake facilitator protein